MLTRAEDGTSRCYCSVHICRKYSSGDNSDFIANYFPYLLLFFLIWRNSPQWPMVSSFPRFLDHTQQRTTLGRTPLDEWSARRRDLYLTIYNNQNRQTSTAPGGIRTHNISRRAAADPRLRPRGHWDRQSSSVLVNKYSHVIRCICRQGGKML